VEAPELVTSRIRELVTTYTRNRATAEAAAATAITETAASTEATEATETVEIKEGA
jgi:hypothetical protein